MADANVVISEGLGTNIDTRTEDTNGNHRQVVVVGDPSSNTGIAPVDATYGLGVDVKRVAVGTLDTGNSTTTPLGIGGVFTGTAVDTKDFVTVNVVVKASHASAANGLSLQFSSDGTNWDIIEGHTISAASGQAHLSRAKARYFRVIYTNGGTAQSYFRLSTMLKNTAISQTFEKLSIDVDDDHDAALVRSILAAKKPNGDYANVQATTAGNLKVSIEEQDAGAGLATETTLQAILDAQGGITYRYVQSEETSLYKYYGYASTNGWQIKRKTISTGVWQTAAGLGDYDTAWADRVSKPYSYILSNAFVGIDTVSITENVAVSVI